MNKQPNYKNGSIKEKTKIQHKNGLWPVETTAQFQQIQIVRPRSIREKGKRKAGRGRGRKKLKR